MDAWLDKTLLGANTVTDLVFFFLAVLLSWLGGRLVRAFLERLGKRIAEKRPTLSVTAIAFGRGIPFLAIGFGLKVAFLFLDLGGPESPVTAFVNTCLAVLITVAFGFLAFHLVDVPDSLLGRFAAKTASKMDDMMVPIIRKSLRLTVAVLTVVQIAQFLSGKSVSSIIAGLGIGGLAVALAAQDTLKNFFGSLVLFADKPFEMGERIVIDGHDGIVEEVGLRSTRVRRLDGHLVTIPNGELANKAIHNIGKRPYIRNLFEINLTYDTPPDKVDEALAILRELLDNHEGMVADFPPRAYFSKFGSHSLDLLVIYWYHPPAYWDYMAFTERLNRQILERFNAAGIDFAFPTRTLYLAGDPKRRLVLGEDGEG
ncbi:MAG: mechanosensitive ion channel family protein [Opitutales bacterium]